jgi:hypothetical protein
LVFDGTVVANAIELTEWCDEPIQLEVCEQCGMVQCKTGGWGVARSMAGAVLFLPAFGAMEDDLTEYSPPLWISEHGPALVPPSLVGSLREAVPWLPAVDSLKRVSASEVARSIQGFAPRQVLGRFPETPVLHGEKLCAVSKGDLSEVVAEVNGLLTSLATEEPVKFREQDGSEAELILYLDAIGYPEWAPVVETRRGLALRWGPYIVEA